MKATQLLQREWIGTAVHVHRAANPAQEGRNGTIIDETKHTFVLRTSNGVKRMHKRGLHLAASIDGQRVLIDATLLERRPHERVKRKKH